MMSLNLKMVKDDVIVRNIQDSDVRKIVDLSHKCFGSEMSLKSEHFKNQLKLFPEGQICVEYKGKMVGNASSLIVNMDDYSDEHCYEEICDEGYIRNHNPTGNHLYGIEVGIDPDYRKMKLGRHLYNGRKRICQDLNLKSIFIGGRMPFFYKYADHLSAEEYVAKVQEEKIYDPVLTFQMRNGFELKHVIKNYLPGDEASLQYGALMEWKNKDYQAK